MNSLRIRTKEDKQASIFSTSLNVISWIAFVAYAALASLNSAKDITHRKPNENASPPGDLLSAKQLEKLKLEIKDLQKRHRWWVQLMPIIATGLGVAGFFFTVYQFNRQRSDEQDRIISEQQKDRMSREAAQGARLQNQIRTDIDEILRSARDEKQTVSSVSFLLGDMKTVLESHVNEKQTVSAMFPEYKRALTDSLIILVRNDCDFTKNPRDVGLANTIIVHWDDYSKYFKENPPKLRYILYEYTRALQNLHDQNPGYLEAMTLSQNKKGIVVGPRYQKQKNESILYHYFLEIVDGFIMHIKLLDAKESEQARGLKEDSVQDFHEALGNRDISNYILDTYLPGEPVRDGR